MKHNRQIRVIKQGQRERAESLSQAVAVADNAEPSERELKTVVTGWVREHRQRSEEYRRAFADLLKQSGFQPPRAAKLA